MITSEVEHDVGKQDLEPTAAAYTEAETGKMATADGVSGNPSGFMDMEEDGGGVGLVASAGKKELWRLDEEEENFIDMNGADSIFYDEFPPLPDFPCMSSSSSSSSAPLVTKPVSAGLTVASSYSSPSPSPSSPATSYTVMKSDAEEDSQRNYRLGDAEPAALCSTASMEIPAGADHDGLGLLDCIDVMENFGYMDLLDDSNEIWDPSSIFENADPQEFLEDESARQQQEQNMQCEEANDGGLGSFLQGNGELSMIFFEWLKKNKDCISAEDVRTIKLKRSTIESASKRLGSTKEGKKQLLKLILEWVGQFQLQKKRMRENGGGGGGGGGVQSPFPSQEIVHFNQNPNPSLNCIPPYPDPSACIGTSAWIPPPPPPQLADGGMGPQALYTGGGYPYAPPQYAVNPLSNQVVNGIPFPPSADYSMMNHAQSWAAPPPPPPPFAMLPNSQFGHFPDNAGTGFPHQHAPYGNPYQILDQNGERLVRLGSSATKEARKNRMARQRKLYSHHNRHSSSSNRHQNHVDDDQLLAGGEDSGINCNQNNPQGNWGYWPPGSSSDPSTVGMIPQADQHAGDQSSRQTPASDRRQQVLKTEKNLKFLLQKVLKQSDVGNLGRIVLPKKEAESHLPELESRDGISIAMEDIGTSRVWNMRYRFWPNNKSRMYLLENTGDFVRANGLQEGDFIVIYSDTRCGRYMIRGVKVRQPGGSKIDAKKPAARRNNRNASSSSSAPIKQAAR